VKRYECTAYEGNEWLEKRKDGDWVKYKDHADEVERLEQKLADSNKAVDANYKRWQKLAQRVVRAENEVERLRTALENIQWIDSMACMTGDCPHKRGECEDTLFKIITESAEEARQALALNEVKK
jgi:hypothetical protein